MFSFFKKKKEILPLPYSTDIHSHLVPGVDDGAKNTDTALFLIGKMKEWGIKHIVTTPHRTDEVFENDPESISPYYNKVKNNVAIQYPDMTFTHSFEYRLDEGFMRLRDEEKLVPFGDNYLLVENSFIQPLWNLDELLYSLRLKGYKPILAHPERYTYYLNNKKAYEELHESGCLFQVNLLSLAGTYGKEVQNLTLWFLEKGYLDFLSTDLHHRQHAALIDEFLKSSAYKKLLPRLQYLQNDLIG